MSDALSILASHVSRTLPDSLSERKSVLRALDNILKDKHPAKVEVRAQLAALETIERLQAELPLKFRS